MEYRIHNKFFIYFAAMTKKIWCFKKRYFIFYKQ